MWWKVLDVRSSHDWLMNEYSFVYAVSLYTTGWWNFKVFFWIFWCQSLGKKKPFWPLSFERVAQIPLFVWIKQPDLYIWNQSVILKKWTIGDHFVVCWALTWKKIQWQKKITFLFCPLDIFGLSSYKARFNRQNLQTQLFMGGYVLKGWQSTYLDWLYDCIVSLNVPGRFSK